MVLAALVVSLLSLQQAPPEPEAFFGFEIGSDRKLASYQRTTEYLRALAEASPWIRVEEIGSTTLGLHQVMAVITKPDHFAKSDRWKEIAARLLDPRKTTPEEARALAAEGKAAVMITCGIHSDEVAASQTAITLAYQLATGRGLPFDREKVLDGVVVLLIPSVNPDGQEMIVDWVARTVGTENEGSPMPRLYHFVAGHDDNRDWFAFNLVETRNISEVLYRGWRPQVLLDHHQMGSRGARYFVPPFGDPLNRAVHPLVWRGANLFGQSIAWALESAGKSGVCHDAYYQGWWQGGLSRAPWWHHGIGILTEAASPALATPLQLDEGELEASGGLPTLTEPLARHPHPWTGGTWRVRDVCEYQRIASYETIRLASERREEILRGVYSMATNAIERGRAGDPFAFVFPAAETERDPAARARLLEMLTLGGVEVLEASEAFGSDLSRFPAGSAVVQLAQPFGPYARDLLEDRIYPDYASAQRPYDITGWTLGRMMGVRCERIEKPFALPRGKILEKGASGAPLFRAAKKGARFYAIDNGSNDAFPSAQRVIAQQKILRRNMAPTPLEDGSALDPGAFLVEAADVPDGGGWLTAGLNVRVAAAGAVSPESLRRVRGVRIGIYEAWSPSMDKGWCHQLVDHYVWRPQLVHNDDLAKTVKLLDALVIPESDPETLWDGGPRSDVKLGRVPFPKEFRGGIGADGVKALRAFVEEGGTLVGLGTSCDFLIDRMELPVTNVLKGAKREEFSCPGSILRMEFDPHHPLAFGMPREGAGFVSSNVAFRTQPPTVRFGRSSFATFPNEGSLILSGYLKGEEKLRGLSAAVEITIGKGRIVLLGLRAQHRNQTDGTFKLFFNSLLAAVTERE